MLWHVFQQLSGTAKDGQSLRTFKGRRRRQGDRGEGRLLQRLFVPKSLQTRCGNPAQRFP